MRRKAAITDAEPNPQTGGIGVPTFLEVEMSYDVTIGEFSFNYTYNVSKLFYDHIPQTGGSGGLHELNGKTGKECVEILADAFDRIERTRMRLWVDRVVGEPEFCALYDADNGWGSAVGGLIFLSNIMAACALNPRKRLSVS